MFLAVYNVPVRVCLRVVVVVEIGLLKSSQVILIGVKLM